jgi:hypothetical protein
MEIPIYLRNSVVRLTQRSDARFSAVLESGDEIVSPVVIVATGAFQKPIVPEMAKTLNASVAQFTTLVGTLLWSWHKHIQSSWLGADHAACFPNAFLEKARGGGCAHLG